MLVMKIVQQSPNMSTGELAKPRRASRFRQIRTLNVGFMVIKVESNSSSTVSLAPRVDHTSNIEEKLHRPLQTWGVKTSSYVSISFN